MLKTINKIRFLIIAGILISLISIFLYEFGLFEKLELVGFDIRTKLLRMKAQPSQDIEVILIDETSLKMMNPVAGRWPWPRSIHADVIDFLRIAGARAIIFDILFTENEKVYGRPGNVLSYGDTRLVESTIEAGNVYHAVQIFRDIPDEYNIDILNKPLPDDFVKRFSIPQVSIIHKKDNNNFAIPFRELYMASKNTGVVEFSPDKDGVYRRVHPLRFYQGNYFPVISLSPLLDILKPITIKEKGRNLLIETENETIKIPLMDDGTYLINHYGDFKPYSMSGIIASIQKLKRGEIENLPISPEEFHEKIVFIGASAVGVEDLKPTPIAPRTPGVLLHSSIYSNIVKRDFLVWVNKHLTMAIITILTFITITTLLFIRRFTTRLIIASLIPFIYILLSLSIFTKNIVIEVVPHLFTWIISTTSTLAFLVMTEEKDKRLIKSRFERYVSPATLIEVIDHSGRDIISRKGQRKYLTILFTDIEGFTSISERLSPEEVIELLNTFFSRMVDIIFKNNGTVDKFMGDALMAFWGAPLEAKNHPEMATLTAMEMIDAINDVNKELSSKNLPFIKAGIGINTGEVVLGNIGSRERLDYTAIGDSVNLASRLQSLTRFYGLPIIISEMTMLNIKEKIPLRIIDRVRVKGKTEPVNIYEPLRDSPQSVKITLLFERAFEYYLNKRWEDAMELYREALSIIPDDPLAMLFIKRCEYLIMNTPSSWDGVMELTEK